MLDIESVRGLPTSSFPHSNPRSAGLSRSNPPFLPDGHSSFKKNEPTKIRPNFLLQQTDNNRVTIRLTAVFVDRGTVMTWL